VPNWVLEVGYVGSHVSIRSPSPVRAPRDSLVLPRPEYCAARGARLAGAVAARRHHQYVANVILRVPELGISAQNPVITTTESYKYNSLQVDGAKADDAGIASEAAYTWSARLSRTRSASMSARIWSPYEPNNTIVRSVWF